MRDNDLVWLQYRILHKILGTRSLLFKMSIEDNNVCRNCGLADETIEHLFFYCVTVNKFLSELYNCIRALTGITYQFRVEEVRFEYIITYTKILLILKYYIYEISRLGSVLKSFTFLSKIRQVYIDQEYMSKVNSQQPKFDRKWSFIKTLIQTDSVNIVLDKKL